MPSHQYTPFKNSICRITTADIWNQLIKDRENIPFNNFDKRDGFVHLSTVEQVLDTLNRYFVAEQQPLILILHRERLQKKLRWEVVPHRDHRSFPHLYRQICFDDIKGILKVEYKEKFILKQYIKIEEYLEKVEKSEK